MQKITKIWITAGALLTALGLIMFAAAMTAYGWNFKRLSTVKYESRTYAVNEEFKDITVRTKTADIIFIPSEDSGSKVVCAENEKMKYTVTVSGGILTIDEADSGKWYDYIGIDFEAPEIAVYIPKGEYGALSVESDTGNIEIPQDFKFESIDISEITGDVTNGASSSEFIRIKTGTGNVKLDGCDSAEIFVKTNTGNVTGSLLSDKAFSAKSGTGTVDVPKTASGGKCEITTSTGDIKITVE